MTATTPTGWLCPSCKKAHGPHVDTCPAAPVAEVSGVKIMRDDRVPPNAFAVHQSTTLGKQFTAEQLSRLFAAQYEEGKPAPVPGTEGCTLLDLDKGCDRRGAT